jgi:hypothetical protein
MTDLPDTCERFGCTAPMATWCPICSRFFCQPHDLLPGGHACLSSMAQVFNVSRRLDDEEISAALERFRPYG